VPITLRVRNQSDHAIGLYLRGRSPTFDIVVTRLNGQVVWRRLDKEMIPAIALFLPIAPGKHLDLTTTWNQRTGKGGRVSPGEYLARALLLTEGDPLESPPVRFHIER